MLKVKITPEMRDKAAKAGKDVATLSNYDVTNYHRLDAPGRYDTGFLGELAFKELLDRYGIKYDYHEEHDENADKGDFHIGNLVIDVKTAGKPGYVNMLVPRTQRRKYDLYVGVRLDGDTAEVHGYCRDDQLRNDPDPKPLIESKGIRLDHLTPIEKLLEHLVEKGVLA